MPSLRPALRQPVALHNGPGSGGLRHHLELKPAHTLALIQTILRTPRPGTESELLHARASSHRTALTRWLNSAHALV